MKAFLKEIKFPSTKSTYFLDLTDDINALIKKSKVKNGLAVINSKHTTLGLIVNEIAEPNLLEDILEHTQKAVPEDKRSTRAIKNYKYPTTDYKHRCQDNPYCKEIDEDYNAAAHIRSISYSQPTITLPIKRGVLALGTYQRIAVFEFDGRNGEGKNPIRQRKIEIWIYPVNKIINL
jgi:thiamine phosphate synthase YjbQ (UPF0047 family)